MIARHDAAPPPIRRWRGAFIINVGATERISYPVGSDGVAVGEK